MKKEQEKQPKKNNSSQKKSKQKSIASEKLEELKEKLKKCQQEREEYLNGWQRARADYINFKKKETERINQIYKNANEELILKLLPILDNLELAENNLSKKLKQNDYIKGIIQIKKQLRLLLKDQGVEEIETEGEKFNPQFHNCVQELESKDFAPGKIIEEVKRGYVLHGKVIRPAEVKVAK